jgi:2-polyprenyl-3-methyl-5-hydroxy-6-metoxy-1,4-benzoquinol methylase
MTAAAPTRPGQGDVAFQAQLYTDPNATRRGLHLARKSWIENRIAAHVDPSHRAVEVGVGCGVFTRTLAARAASVEAIDINPRFLDALAGVPGVSIREADATRAFAEEAYDLALCSEVIEHVPPERSQAMLEALHSALKPGGVLILTTPQRYSMVELFARLLDLPPVLRLARRLYGHAEELGHINRLTSGALRAQIGKAGFAVEDHALIGLYLPAIAEFGGEAGWSLLQRLERIVRAAPLLRGLIWTQAYVLRKRAA